MAKRSRKHFRFRVCLVRRASAHERANPIRIEGETTKVIDHFTHLVKELQAAKASPTGFIKHPCRCKDQMQCPDLVSAEVTALIARIREYDPALVETLTQVFTRQ